MNHLPLVSCFHHIIGIFEKNLFVNLEPQNDSSLLEYIRCELKRGYQLQNDEQRYRERREKFYIFLKIPYKLETVS